MNGMKPKFLEGITLSDDYYRIPDPTKNPSSAGINLLELSRYAKGKGKRLVDLSKEEVDKFAINA